jgi:hypothetical protein
VSRSFVESNLLQLRFHFIAFLCQRQCNAAENQIVQTRVLGETCIATYQANAKPLLC